MCPKQHRDLLHLAIEEGNRGIVRQIINENLDFVEQKSTQGERPLVRAIELNHIEIVKDLLDLIHAIEFGSFKVVKLLIQLGANIFVRDSQNTSVLTYAKNINALLYFEKKHRLEIVNFLQICGAIE